MGGSEHQRCVCMCVSVSRYVVGRKREWILNVCGCVWLVKAMYDTSSSLIDDNLLCDTFGLYEEICLSRLMRQTVLTKEASVCARLGIDHMALTRVGSGRMIGKDGDFIPHHMYQLEVSCCSPSRGWFRASPHWASTRGQFTKCHKHLRLWGIMGVRMLFIPPSTHPSSLIKSHSQLDVLSGEVLVTLWVWVQPTVPRIHPSRAFFVLVCHTAAMLSVCKSRDIPVYLCLSGWLERIHVDLWTRSCIYQT